ncbi:PHP-associated domain-containing protein [Niallia circulans]|uniref:PHP-associated domain-containing protein n=1 Tax=Niallia circulans TaxID=1397 RepID=UPI0026EF291D|nr:PHP-associated domain-containing protein [Niallia circulans]
MKIDFHSHVKISKKTDFMPAYFQEMMKEAKEAGLTAIAMTEHFNTRRFTDIYDFLDRHYSYVGDYYDIDGLKLFPGVEVDVKEIGHILLIGNRTDILSIRSLLENNTNEDSFLIFDQLLDIADHYDVLKIGAHAFRESTPLYHLQEEQLKRLDALDLNGKDLFSQGQDAYREKLEHFAEKLGLPIVGGSDTHHFLQYGCIYNEIQNDCDDVKALKASIDMGKYKVHISENLNLKVRAATLTKKWMKKVVEKETQVRG